MRPLSSPRSPQEPRPPSSPVLGEQEVAGGREGENHREGKVLKLCERRATAKRGLGEEESTPVAQLRPVAPGIFQSPRHPSQECLNKSLLSEPQFP